MRNANAYRVEPQEGGGLLVQLIDVAEAHPLAAGEAGAGAAALDCLIAALGG